MTESKTKYNKERRPKKDNPNTKILPWHPMEHADDFLMELQVAMRTESYIYHIRMALTYFFLWCRDNNIRNYQEIERRDLLHFQAWVQEQDWKRSYQIVILAYVRRYFAWLRDSKLVDESPWYNIRIGRIVKRPNPILPEDVELLFQTHTRRAFRISPFRYHREEVILVLLYSWGLRVHELAALNVSQFDPRAQFITTINKGGTNKSLPYQPEQKEIISRWLNQRANHALHGEDALLINAHGGRISTGSIRTTVESLGREAGIHITPHMLRDTCGTDLLTADMPVERVAKILGHASTQTTLTYAKVRDHRVAEDHARVMGPRIEALLSQGFERTGKLAPARKPKKPKKQRGSD